jgi:flavin reductase (DIM6/NTAB) family NADH-FMN oxidoreductase RutF
MGLDDERRRRGEPRALQLLQRRLRRAADDRVLQRGDEGLASFALQTREFVWNMPTWHLREAMNATSASLRRGANEFDHAGLEMAPSRLVAPPRVAASPCALECKVTATLDLPDVAGNPTDRHTRGSAERSGPTSFMLPDGG